MSHSHEKGLLYGLYARIGPVPAFFAALQHLLASVVGIITPPLIIGSVLGLQTYLPYLISMSLFVSGLGTFMQARRFYGVGAGMICLQGTSFAFLGVILSGGLMVKGRGGSPEEIMAMLFGCNLVAALIPVLISRCVGSLRKVLTPVVTGTVITLIGISLIKVSVTDWAGGHNATDFGSPGNLALGALTLLVIVAIAFGIGLGVEAVPEVLKQFPPLINSLFGHAVTTGGILAIVLNLVLPDEAPAVEEVEPEALTES